jgi:predicted nucleic acid-binding protein
VNVVVDSSVWVDFFSGRGVPVLEQALDRGAVLLSPVVLAELVSGARNARELRQLDDLLGDLPLHATPREHWWAVGRLRRFLAEKGVSISTPDAHVAQCALDVDVPLFSRDAVFGKVAAHTALRLVS